MLPLEAKPKWHGTKALAIRREACACGPLDRADYTQPALFAHGGYGAAERVVARWCICGKVKQRDTEPRNPRHL